jgi:mRNA capping enzyme
MDSILYYAKKLENAELEARFKGPILAVSNVQRLLHYYSDWKEDLFLEKRCKVASKKGCVYRQRILNLQTHEDSVGFGGLICKSTIVKEKFYDKWITWVLSTEVPVPISAIPKFFSTTQKKRYSRMINDYLQVDVTYNFEEDSYQVELEITHNPLDKGSHNPQTLTSTLNFVEGSQVNPEPLSQSSLQECVHQIASIMQDSPMFVTRTTYDCISMLWNKRKYKYQKPKTLMLDTIIDQSYWMTAKLDGERRFVYIVNDFIYSIDLKQYIRKICITNENLNGAILDTEFIDGVYYIIESDPPILKGELPESIFKEKPYYDVPKTYDAIDHFYEELKQQPDLPVDGLIFGRDSDGVCYKWKPRTTVDIFVDTNGNLLSGEGKQITGVQIVGWNGIPGIYEFSSINPQTSQTNPKRSEGFEGSKELNVVKPRYDKPRANGYDIIKANLGKDHAPSTLWKGYGCISMRKFHNEVKRIMYEMVSHENTWILDIGTGQGGDLSKWKGARKVTCVDPRSEAFKELDRRMQGKTFSFELEKINEYLKDVNLSAGWGFNIISLFFCLNSFEQEDFDKLFEIASKLDNARIVGIFLDADQIKYESNSCFDIFKINEKQYHITLHGTRINQKENFLRLEQIAKPLEDRGYKLMFSNLLIPNGELGFGGSASERKLSGMFRAFEFRNTKSNLIKWHNERLIPIKINYRNRGIIHLDDSGNPTKIDNPKNYKYYYIRNKKGLYMTANSADFAKKARLRLHSTHHGTSNPQTLSCAERFPQNNPHNGSGLEGSSNEP